MAKCEKCGGKMKVVYTNLKGKTRRRVRMCPECGYAYSTIEKFDSEIHFGSGKEKHEMDEKFR